MGTEIEGIRLSAKEQESIKNHTWSIRDVAWHIDNGENSLKYNKIMVYLVDDDKILLHTLKYSLSSMHHERIEIKTFSTAEDCIESAKVLHPSIVILDYYLDHDNPNAMNGARALKKLKQICPETKVVMLSAQNNIDIAMDVIKNKAHDYVSKGDNAYYKIKNIVRYIASDIEMNENLKRQNKFLRLVNIGILVCIITITLLLQNFTKVFNFKSQAIDGDKSIDGDHAIALVIDGDKSIDGDKNIGPTDGDKYTKVEMG